METLNHDGSLMVQDGGISHDGGLVQPNVGQTAVLPPYVLVNKRRLGVIEGLTIDCRKVWL